MTRRSPLGIARAALLALAALALPAQAPAPNPPATPPARPAADVPRPLPAARATHHVLALPGGRSLRFTATAGALRLSDAEGKPQADLAYTAFTLDGADPATRPVTLAVNGGPGASSAWLDFGAVGPWRLPFGGTVLSPSAPPVLVDNAETWLDFTDLVFLDPPGTGWSRALNEDARKRAWSVAGDIALLAAAGRRWLTENRRLVSPKLVLGESYGGFRGPRLVAALRGDGVGIGGLVLVSPLLDFGGRAEGYDPMPFVRTLPSMVAAVRGATDRAALADVEAYAAGDYLLDLVRGEGDAPAVGRIAGRLAALLPGVDPATIRRRAGRLDTWTFLRDRRAAEGQVGSIYDSNITTADPFPAAAYTPVPDPILEPMRAAMTSAAVDAYARRLEWLPEGRYEILSDTVFRRWEYGNGRNAPESYTALRRILALDPALRVMVAHGIDDLITPYFASKLILDSLPPLGPPGRAQLRVYGGGHMFYAGDASRIAFRDDAQALVGAMAVRPAPAPGGAAAAGTAPPAAPAPPSR